MLKIAKIADSNAKCVAHPRAANTLAVDIPFEIQRSPLLFVRLARGDVFRAFDEEKHSLEFRIHSIEGIE